MKLKLTGVEEGREFKISKLGSNIYKIENGILFYKNNDKEWFPSRTVISDVLGKEIEMLPEKIKITEKERRVLDGRLAEGYNFIAKDKYGSVWCFVNKPHKTKCFTCWRGGCGGILIIKLIDFKFLKWEDEEPTNIKELLDNAEVIL